MNCASIPFGLLICFLCCQVVIAAPPAAPDFVGTYHLESMTKQGQVVPTNFAGITIILKANGEEVKNVTDLQQILNKAANGTVKLEGVFPGYEGVYTYSLKLASGE